jgi:hypothetical protein
MTGLRFFLAGLVIVFIVWVLQMLFLPADPEGSEGLWRADRFERPARLATD